MVSSSGKGMSAFCVTVSPVMASTGPNGAAALDPADALVVATAEDHVGLGLERHLVVGHGVGQRRARPGLAEGVGVVLGVARGRGAPHDLDGVVALDAAHV